MAKDNDMAGWQIAQLGTLNHEVGHTVGRILMGEMVTENTDSTEMTKTSRPELADILRRYGVLRDEADPTNFQVMQTYMDTGVLTEHVSKYGASSLHEMMAESWASYMMNESPTEMQLEIAQLMEYYLIEWLRSEFPNEEKYQNA